MKEWKRTVSEKTFFKQDFIQGEIFTVDTYFYPEDVTYYATEKGLHIEKVNKVPQEYEQDKSKWNFYVVLHTRFQFPAYEKRKPIETTLEDILQIYAHSLIGKTLDSKSSNESSSPSERAKLAPIAQGN